jgi:hypothetical protein
MVTFALSLHDEVDATLNFAADNANVFGGGGAL